MANAGFVARVLALQNTGGFTNGASQLDPSGGPLPGTPGPTARSKAQANSGVPAQTANATIIIKRGSGTPAPTPEQRRRLPKEDLWSGDSTPDETTTIAQAMDYAYHEKEKDVLARQQHLVAAGLLDPNGYLPGVFDPPTAKAYQTLLTEASYSDSTPDEVQARRTKSLTALGGPDAGGTKRQPLVIEYTDPRDIQTGVDKLAPDIIGHGLSPAQVGDLVAAFHGSEGAYQQARYSQSDINAKGGQVTQPPQLQSFLEQELQNRYPVDYQAMQIANNVGALMKMIGGGTTGG